MLRLAAAAESRSEHPLGRAAFVAATAVRSGAAARRDFELTAGRGIAANSWRDGITCVAAAKPTAAAGAGISRRSSKRSERAAGAAAP